MPRKTKILKVSVGLLFIALGTPCFGTDQPQYLNMTETLNAQWNERIWQSLPKLESKPQKPFFGGCRGHVCFFCGPPRLVLNKQTVRPIPPRSKNSLPDEPVSNIISAFKSCTELSMLSLNRAGPVSGSLVGLSKVHLYEKYLITRRIETDDTFPMVFLFRWLVETLQTNDASYDFNQGSVDAEIDELRKISAFIPSVVFKLEGKDWLIVELDLRRCSALVRTKCKWGIYGFDELSAEAIEALINSFTELYPSASVAD